MLKGLRPFLPWSFFLAGVVGPSYDLCLLVYKTKNKRGESERPEERVESRGGERMRKGEEAVGTEGEKGWQDVVDGRGVRGRVEREKGRGVEGEGRVREGRGEGTGREEYGAGGGAPSLGIYIY